MEHSVRSRLLSVLLVIALPFSVVAAQPTADQVRMFQSLSPAQQQKALEMYSTEKSVPKTAKGRQLENKDSVIVENNDDIVQPEADHDEQVEENIADSADAVPEVEEEKEKVEFEEVKQFGYDLFAGAPTTFAPAANIPVPLSYVMGADDNVLIQLYGKQNETYDLVISRDGTLQFPGIGPILVAGMSFSDMQEMLKDTIDKQLIGVKASISLGVLRSIRVFVLGEVERPGSYTVSSLSTMTNALFASGGIKGIGSLRNIQLKRAGKMVAQMDLYDLLLQGDTSADAMLMPGDVIFVPPVRKTVGVIGEVRRPAIYELNKEKNMQQLLQLAGGLLPTAYSRIASIQRITEKGERTYKDIDLRIDAANEKLYDGDVLKVFSVLDKVENVVLLQGHVRRELGVSWFKGMRITDAIPSVDVLLPNVDLSYALIQREVKADKSIEILGVDLAKVFADPKGEENIKLASGDKITVFKMGEGRAEELTELVEELKQQATQNSPAKIVTIEGNIRSPGEYPLHKGMTLKGVISVASDLLPRTDLDYVLIKRVDNSTGEINVIQTSLNQQGQAGDFQIESEDTVLIFDKVGDRQELLEPLIEELSGNIEFSTTAPIVNIEGQVRFPGDYPYMQGMSVDDLVKAAGGYLQSVYLQDAEITRFEVKDAVKRQVANIKVNLTADADTTEIKPYDRLFVRQIPDWNEVETVEIWGEVKFPGVYTVSKNDTLYQLVQRAGGLTEYADPNAAVFSRESLKEREEQQLQRYRQQLDQIFAGKQLESTQDKENLTPGADKLDQDLVNRLSSVEAIGRLVIDFTQLVTSEGKDINVKLLGGDKLYIPREQQQVMIMGEVNFPTSHLHKNGYLLEDYVSESGGLTAKADEDRIYVIKSNGAVLASDSSAWFSQVGVSINPGDTIVVPYDVDAVSPMVQWSNVSRILFQLATTAATLKTVGVF